MVHSIYHGSIEKPLVIGICSNQTTANQQAIYANNIARKLWLGDDFKLGIIDPKRGKDYSHLKEM